LFKWYCAEQPYNTNNNNNTLNMFYFLKKLFDLSLLFLDCD